MDMESTGERERVSNRKLHVCSVWLLRRRNSNKLEAVVWTHEQERDEGCSREQTSMVVLKVRQLLLPLRLSGGKDDGIYHLTFEGSCSLTRIDRKL